MFLSSLSAAKFIFEDVLEDRLSFMLRNITPDLQPKCCALFIRVFTFLSSVGNGYYFRIIQ